MDNFVRGFIIGVLTSAVKDGINAIDYFVFHITNIRYPDFMASIVMGRPIHTVAEYIICQIIELGYEGMIGILFIYFANRTRYKKNLWFKGLIIGIGAYIINYALASFFKLPVIKLVDAKTIISQVLTSGLFGILMGICTYWWGKRLGDYK